MSSAAPRAQVLVPARSGLAGGTTGVTSYAWSIDRHTSWPRHEHTDHEFVHVVAGTFVLDLGGSVRVVPPTLGVWIPAGVPHGAGAEPGTDFHCVYVDPERLPSPWPSTTVVPISPVLAAIVGHLAGTRMTPAARLRAEDVLFDLLEPLDVAPPHLPVPRDDRAGRVAAELIRRPADGRTLEQWGYAVGASPRTLTRRFVAETGMTFEQWRLHCRLGVAVARLASGSPVGTVARGVGYRSVAAFVLAFRQVHGETPGEYAGRMRPAGDRRRAPALSS